MEAADEMEKMITKLKDHLRQAQESGSQMGALSGIQESLFLWMRTQMAIMREKDPTDYRSLKETITTMLTNLKESSDSTVEVVAQIKTLIDEVRNANEMSLIMESVDHLKGSLSDERKVQNEINSMVLAQLKAMHQSQGNSEEILKELKLLHHTMKRIGADANRMEDLMAEWWKAQAEMMRKAREMQPSSSEESEDSSKPAPEKKRRVLEEKDETMEPEGAAAPAYPDRDLGVRDGMVSRTGIFAGQMIDIETARKEDPNALKGAWSDGKMPEPTKPAGWDDAWGEWKPPASLRAPPRRVVHDSTKLKEAALDVVTGASKDEAPTEKGEAPGYKPYETPGYSPTQPWAREYSTGAKPWPAAPSRGEDKKSEKSDTSTGKKSDISKEAAAKAVPKVKPLPSIAGLSDEGPPHARNCINEMLRRGEISETEATRMRSVPWRNTLPYSGYKEGGGVGYKEQVF